MAARLLRRQAEFQPAHDARDVVRRLLPCVAPGNAGRVPLDRRRHQDVEGLVRRIGRRGGGEDGGQQHPRDSAMRADRPKRA